MDTLMYKGIVLSNFDPNKLMRVKIFIPELSTQNCEWLKSRTNDQPLRYPGLPSLTKAEKDKLIDLLPWAEQCAPLMGESGLARYHDPSGKQVPKARLVPQKQAQSNPPTRQKGGAQGRVTSTIQTEPGGGAAIPGRQSFANMSDQLKRDLFELTQQEVGNQGVEAQQAFMETIANRSALRATAQNDKLKHTIHHTGYFPDSWDKIRAGRNLTTSEDRARYAVLFDRVAGGSDISLGATHAATGKAPGEDDDPLGIKEGGKQSVPGSIIEFGKGSPGGTEIFYSKTGDQNWVTRRKAASLQPGDYGYVENQNTNVTDGFADGKYGKHNIYGAAYTPRNSGSETSGVYGIPQVGAHVWVFHRRGDINFPVYFGVSPGYKDTGLVYANDGSPDAFENASSHSTSGPSSFSKKAVTRGKVVIEPGNKRKLTTLNDDLVAALNAGADATGVAQVWVYSPAQESGKGTGSHRHDDQGHGGMAADFRLIDTNGNLVPISDAYTWGNFADAFRREAESRDYIVSGGSSPNYMGPNEVHFDIAAGRNEGVAGEGIVWGAKGSSSDPLISPWLIESFRKR